MSKGHERRAVKMRIQVKIAATGGQGRSRSPGRQMKEQCARARKDLREGCEACREAVNKLQQQDSCSHQATRQRAQERPVGVGVLLYLTLLYLSVPYCTSRYLIVLYCTLLYLTVPYCTLLYLTAPYLYLSVPYCTLLYLTAHYCTLVYQLQ